MSNRKLGNDFELEFCFMLFEHGFWVHGMAQNQAGQPADVIAVKNGIAYLIDCKVCSRGGFDLRRVEENQDSSMTLWRECGNGEGWFALKLRNKVYMFAHCVIEAYSKDFSTLSSEEIVRNGIPLEDWVKLCE